MILPLGAVIWAAVEKMLGFTPEGMIAEIGRNSVYPRVDWEEIVYRKLRAALDGAEAFANRMPTDLVGFLFLKYGKVLQPDPDHLDLYESHAGRRGDHWPSNVEIETAMLEEYDLQPRLQPDH